LLAAKEPTGSLLLRQSEIITLTTKATLGWLFYSFF